MRASELKSDFRTGRSSILKKMPSVQSEIEETVYSKEESFNKLTPKSNTLDKSELKQEFKNGVMNISDYLDSN